MKRLTGLLLCLTLLLTPLCGGVNADVRHIPATFLVMPVTAPPTIDGDLKDWPAAAKIAAFDRASLAQGAGEIWRDAEYGDYGITYLDPQPLTAEIYAMYTSDALYLGVRARYENHRNSQYYAADLWMEDSLNMQLSAFPDRGRNEYGFALSAWAGGTAMSYAWNHPEINCTEESGDVDIIRNLSARKGSQGMTVVRKDDVTTYEMRIPLAAITPAAYKSSLAAGDKLYFALALHTTGGFYEWGDGVIGGSLEKDIGLANVLVLGAKLDSDPSLPTVPWTNGGVWRHGDVDNSGKIDSTDARYILQYEVGPVAFSNSLQALYADADGDGLVDSTDARLILQHEVRLVSLTSRWNEPSDHGYVFE